MFKQTITGLGDGGTHNAFSVFQSDSLRGWQHCEVHCPVSQDILTRSSTMLPDVQLDSQTIRVRPENCSIIYIEFYFIKLAQCNQP